MREYDLTEEEVEIIKRGLLMRVCYIETGDPTLRAADIYAMDDETQENLRRRGVRVQALEPSQMKTILITNALLTQFGG